MRYVPGLIMVFLSKKFKISKFVLMRYVSGLIMQPFLLKKIRCLRFLLCVQAEVDRHCLWIMKQKVMFLIMRKPLKGFRNVVHLLPSAETARAKKKFIFTST